MLLVTDVGNSHTVLGLYDNDILTGRWRVMTGNYRTADELHILLAMLLQGAGVHPKQITGCCVSSVVPQLNAALVEVSHHAFGVEPVMVEPGIKTGLRLKCDNPKEVGADRIVNTVGALESNKPPFILIDFGTATTFDAVNEKAEWLGGVIVPGIQLSADALFERCAKLPRVDIALPPAVIGRDTVTNIQSGLTFGFADMVDGLVFRMRGEMKNEARVIATGGLAKIVAKVAKTIDLVDPDLTLKGLRAVYHKNSRETS